VKGKVTGSAGTNVQASAIEVRRPNEILLEGSPDAIDPAGIPSHFWERTWRSTISPVPGRDGDGPEPIRACRPFDRTQPSAWRGFRRHGPVGQGLGDEARASDPGPASSVTAQGAASAVAFPAYNRPWPSRDRRSTGQRQNTDYFLPGGIQTDGRPSSRTSPSGRSLL